MLWETSVSSKQVSPLQNEGLNYKGRERSVLATKIPYFACLNFRVEKENARCSTVYMINGFINIFYTMLYFQTASENASTDFY